MSRRVVITGANRGLGLELARQCAARGDRVWAACRAPAQADGLKGLDRVQALPLDVANPGSITAFTEALAIQAESVDLLINNAGVNGTAFGATREAAGVLELPADNFRQQMDVNAVGPMLLTRSLIPMLRAAPQGVVVNVTSQLGSLTLGMQMRRDIGYNASKAALNMITRALAGTLGPEGLIAITLHPGWVRTDMGGSEAPLTASASAAAILSTIDGLRPEDNGAFLNWDGSPHPW